ncbi:NADH-quinone oxidoreductase subunit J [Halococcus agarilyticus]|uniref:NADH-quinone oxidoreductase subunit J n=1 Tax=Halococcus agarilyticus TaxID=1232219 RepID=UPI00067782E6|nr:NADH-quinone oxidoreductase subunit J [Halococcus agarilyticus]
MTTRPRLKTDGNFLPGLIALALFGVFAAVFLTASFPEPTGFTGGGSITAAIGYAMFALEGGTHESETFLVAFEIIDIVLVAALAAAVMLAKTEEDGRIGGALRIGSSDTPDDDTATRTDGGRDRDRGEEDR